MNTNNKEAIELLREAYNNMDISLWESKCIKKALSLLQDNEDTEDYDEDEVSIFISSMGDNVTLLAPSLPIKLSYKKFIDYLSINDTVLNSLIEKKDTEVEEECRCIKARNHAEICSNCVVETRYHKPSSKVEKLKELRNGLVLSQMADRFVLPSELINLIDTLIEEEE